MNDMNILQFSKVDTSSTMKYTLSSHSKDHESNNVNNGNNISHLLTINNVSCTVEAWTRSWWACGCCRRDTKRILNELQLSIRSGQLVAFIGNSGSGKTSLLDVITNRHTGRLTGEIRLDGNKLTNDIIAKRTAYVLQHDRLLALLTVRETLMYAGKLAYCGKLNSKKIEKKVEQCLVEMGLEQVADSAVGGVIERGISGGERRRLSIAVQLLQNPDILLLDEPTTGLDSFTAHYLVKTLARLAHQDNKMVILTLHQPRSDIFHLLDSVGILSAGEMVYFGSRHELIPHFSKLGHPCSKYSNPLDVYIDLCSMDYRSDTKEARSLEKIRCLVEDYRNSDLYHSIKSDVEINKTVSYTDTNNFRTSEGDPCSAHCNTSKYGAVEIKIENKHKTFEGVDTSSKFTQFWSFVGTLLNRMYRHIVRDKRGFANRLVNMTLYALFIWLFCWRLGTNSKSIQDRLGTIYLIISVSCAVGMLTAYNNFPQHRDLYYRESGDGVYSCIHFLSAYFIHILPFQVTSSIAFITWTYWSIGMYPDVGRYFICCAVSIVQQHLGELQTVACMALVFDDNTARAMANMLITISSQYASGLLKSTESLIAPLEYLTYINHYKYAAEVLVVNEFAGSEFHCDEITSNCTITGEAVIEGLYPGSADDKFMNLGILLAMVACYWILVILIYLARGRKILH